MDNKEITDSDTISYSNKDLSVNCNVSKIRYFLLIIFIILSMSNSFHWVMYAIVENIAEEYYRTTSFWIDSTSTIYMITYVIFIIPATYFLDRFGLRISLIIGASCNALGSFIKCFSIERSQFWICMVGQTISACGQLFILNIPPMLSATWFAANEVNVATAYGVFGNQIGIGFGFLIPPLLMPKLGPLNTTNVTLSMMELNPEFSDEINIKIRQAFIWITRPMAIICLIILILIIIVFKDKPDVPPSDAQALRTKSEKESYIESMRGLIHSRNFCLLFFSYGLNAGVFYAISTVLGAIVVKTMGSEYQSYAGYMGSLIVISGIFGSIICGYILAWSGKYKLITVITYVLAMVGFIIFAVALKLKSILMMFFVSVILGFFMTGYLPIGFEYAAEVTYPQSEGTSAGLLNASAQIFGIILTYCSLSMIDIIGPFWVNIGFAIILAIGVVLTLLITNDLRRQETAQAMKKKSLSNELSS